jgi:hypothetical protein
MYGGCGWLQRSVLVVVAAGLLSCSGAIQDPHGNAGAAVGGRGPAAVGRAAPGASGGAGSGALPGSIDSMQPQHACTPGSPLATTRLVRLTHHQYDNTVADLTGLDLKLASNFLADQHQAGFDRGIDLQVGDVLAKAYRDAAEQIADKVVTTPAAYARVLGCDPATGDACAKSFIAGFGKKLLRRPLSAAEQTSYLTLFKQGPALADSGDDFSRGVRIALEALLQSPKFLYRVELSSQAQSGLIALSSYEVATRLAYALVNTTPDAMLLSAADTNKLTTADAVATQAGRLLAGQAAHETVRDFHHQWLDLDVYANKLTKDSKLYPSVTPALAPVLQTEVERFVDAVSFTRKRGLSSLFTAPFTFVNSVTAPLYGLTGKFGDTLQQVDLDPKQRAGLLTQVGFLATRAFTASSSPIHRGVFIQRRLLCNTIPDPPPNVPGLPPVDGTNIKTTRQQVDQHTAREPCASCHHTLINPVGFGLENYDAVGSFRSMENGVAIDASGMLAGTADKTAFTDGVQLAQALAAAPESRLCYAKAWFRYTLGREETAADSCALQVLADRLADDNYTALDLLTDMTRTEAFLVRAENK